MVFLSYRYMSGIEHGHLIRDVNNAINNTQDNIRSELLEPETLLGSIAQTVRGMVLSDDNEEHIQEYFININNYLTSNEQRRLLGVIGFYGVFNVFNDIFISGDGVWAPPEDYIIHERPWYNSAINANGDVGVTQPYIDEVTGEVVITFSRRIFDDNKVPLGIVCLDMKLDKIRGYAINTYASSGGYGILFDNDCIVLAHPVPENYLGKSLLLMNDGPAIEKLLKEGHDIVERKAHDYKKEASLLFVKRIYNGWYMAVVAYEKNYNKSVYYIARILIILGALFATVLSAILLNIVHKKNLAEERSRIMMDATPLCANFWDRKLKLVDCNREALSLFNMSSKQEYLEKFFNLMPEYQYDGQYSKDKLLDAVKKAFQEGDSKIDLVYRKLDGENIPCEISLTRVKYRDDYIVTSYARDLRELKAKEAKVKEVNDRIQIMFNASPFACIFLNKDLHILDCNMKTVELFKLPNKQEYFSRYRELSPEYQPSGELSVTAFSQYINGAFEDGYNHFEWMHKTFDGEELPTEMTLVRVNFEEENAVVIYIRDLRELKAMIREMRKAEIANESNKAKTNFLARMSHEIRTPMNAILGITEIQLQDETLPIITKDAFNRIYNSGDLLLGIINDILDLSKIEAGKFELANDNYDIASLINDTIQLNIMRYEDKPIKFKLDVNELIPLILTGDEMRIKQILNNLLSNAFKYTQEGMINLSITTVPPIADGFSITLVFRVSDTGQGMTAEQVGKLGTEYSRFNSGVNRVTEGTGLGMNITRNLIQLMKGDMVIDSVPGMGSTFTVRLPQNSSGSEVLGKELAENLGCYNMESAAHLSKTYIKREFMPYGRILIVDDVESNLYVAKGLLAPYGLSIDSCTNGFDALDRIKNGSEYDIIFMDHMMPRMDGIETVKRIRALGYKHPIVALTANALTGQAQIFLGNGFDDFISKPIDIRQLNVSLNKFIRDKQPQEVIDKAREQQNIISSSSKDDTILIECFIRDAEKAVQILDSVIISRFRKTDDVSMFIINIHAMKSALANIGEKDLSNEALRLEQAGRERNIDMIMNETPAFINALKDVIKKVKPVEAVDEILEISADDQLFLSDKLQIIQASCADYNKKTAKEALIEINSKKWTREISQKLNVISEHLLHSEFDEASGIAGEIAASVT
jgi:signal transduction histidine kinase/FixJ family two-component response regulator